ncbi:hypothetical protein K5I29_13200 [Flavobacterium agricola]|nr:hypothetical protein [Flavobacterium agricola]UYW01371.1 hypothetical protein K5I29_13200 [Flavobacterium agricola]
MAKIVPFFYRKQIKMHLFKNYFLKRSFCEGLALKKNTFLVGSAREGLKRHPLRGKKWGNNLCFEASLW